MVSPKRVTVASRAVAALVFAPFVASILVVALPAAAVGALGLRAVAAPLPGTAGGLYFVSLGWLLSLVLIVRVFVTDKTVDAVLAAVSLPCLVVAPVVVYRTFLTAPPAGSMVVYPVLTAAAGVLLAGFVLLEGAMDLRRSVRRRRSKTSV